MYRSEIEEDAKTLKLWVRRKAGKLLCSGCGRTVVEIAEVSEREVRDLSCFEYRTTVVVELYRLRCPDCGIKTEKVPQLPSKAPFSKRFEDAVGEDCECAAARRVAKQFGLAATTVRSIRFTVFGALGGAATQTGIVPTGSGRDSSGKEAEIPDRSQQPGEWRAAMVRAGEEEGNAGRVLPDGVDLPAKDGH